MPKNIYQQYVYELIRTDHDDLENRDPLSSESLGMFNSLKSLRKHIREQLKTISIYCGYDYEIYPKFNVKRSEVK